MCLYIDSHRARPTGAIEVYKVVWVISESLQAVYFPYLYHPGENTASGRGLQINEGAVKGGCFHAFVEESSAHFLRHAIQGDPRRSNQDFRVIRLTGHPKDWVAYGVTNEVAFTKLHLQEAEYYRVLNESRVG